MLFVSNVLFPLYTFVCISFQLTVELLRRSCIVILIVYVNTTVFITQGNYIGYMFRLFNSHLQAHFYRLSNRMLCTHWDPSVFISVKYLSQITYLGK